jgi:hypothetical protein
MLYEIIETTAELAALCLFAGTVLLFAALWIGAINVF